MAVRLKKKLISVVIKNESIKIAEVSKHSKYIKVYKAFVADTPVGAVNDGIIENIQELAAVIKEALEANGVMCREVVFSIISGKIATKEVVIPEVKEKKISEIVSTNAAEYFPVNIEQYIVKYTCLERFRENNDSRIKLQVVAAPSALVETYYKLAEILGLKIADIDYAGNSTYQLLKQQISPEFNLVINIENESTVVSIFDKNALKMQRTIPYGQSVLVQAAMDTMGTESEEEALSKLQGENLLHPSFDGDEITESVNYLVANISRITDYYTSRNQSRRFERAYVVGEATDIQGLVTLLSNELNLDFISIRTLENVAADSHASDISKRLTAFVSNIGALIAPVGLMSISDEKKESKRSNTGFMAGILAGAVIIGAALVFVPMINMMSTKSDLDKVRKHIEEISDINDTVDKYYTAADMVSDARAFANMTSNNNDSLHIFISRLEENIPSDIYLSGMSVSSGSVSISGNASSKSSVAKLIQQLDSIDSVSDVYVASQSETKDSAGVISVTFSLTCTFGDMAEAEAE